MSVAKRLVKIWAGQKKVEGNFPQPSFGGKHLAKKLYLLPCYGFLVGGLLSCNSMAQSGVSVLNSVSVPVTSIADIPQNQETNSTVYLKGKVAAQAPFMGSGAYELRDTTGKIWVLTTQTLPSRGDEVLIKGQVQYQSIPLAGKDIGEAYLQEQEQLERKPAPKGSTVLPEETYE